MTHHIIYGGPAALASALVGYLEDESVTVQWTPPSEDRSIPGAGETIGLEIAASGSTSAMRAAIAKFEAKFGDLAQVEFEPGEDTDH
jgi:hypothetical protein